MARHYSAKTFLRNVPNALLQEYFASKSIDLGLEWVRLGETDVDHIFLALEKLPAPTRSLVDTEFSSVNELACADGIAAILEEARLWGRNWADSFAGMTNHYERAFRTFLHEPQCFRVARCFHDMDRRGGWRRRFVGYRLEASSDPEALRDLEGGLQLFYRRQGRGRFCHVDCYSRQDPDRQCYFAYPEDYASTDVGYDDGGEFRRRPRRSALEIIFVYRPEEGVLELCARGDKKQLLEIEEIFCRTILDLEELPDEQDRVPYELAILKNREFPFPTDPRDRITAVHVRQMRFDLRRPRGGRIARGLSRAWAYDLVMNELNHPDGTLRRAHHHDRADRVILVPIHAPLPALWPILRARTRPLADDLRWDESQHHLDAAGLVHLLHGDYATGQMKGVGHAGNRDARIGASASRSR